MASSEMRTSDGSDERSPASPSFMEKRCSELRLPEDGPQVRGRSSAATAASASGGASLRIELSHEDLLVVDSGVVLWLEVALRSYKGDEKLIVWLLLC